MNKFDRKSPGSIDSFLSGNNAAYIEYLLESFSPWFYWDTEPFQNKYIELVFDYPVWIKYIELLPDREVSYNLHFIWQQSNDSMKWEPIGEEYNNTYKTLVDPFYGYTITVLQNSKQGKKAKHWRMYGLGVSITNAAWLRSSFITLIL